MSLAKLTTKGQITLPKLIREHLELHAGDKVEFVIDTKGKVIVTPKTIDVKEVFGMIKLKSVGKVSIEDMNKCIAKKIKKKHKHGLS